MISYDHMTYISDVVVLSHEHVEWCAGMSSYFNECRAAMS